MICCLIDVRAIHVHENYNEEKYGIFLLLFHSSDAADSAGGRKSVSQSQKRPFCEERGTRIIKPTRSGTNAGKYSAKIAWLRCLHQNRLSLSNFLSFLLFFKWGSYFTGFAIPHFCKRIVSSFFLHDILKLLTYF